MNANLCMPPIGACSFSRIGRNYLPNQQLRLAINLLLPISTLVIRFYKQEATDTSHNTECKHMHQEEDNIRLHTCIYTFLSQEMFN